MPLSSREVTFINAIRANSGDNQLRLDYAAWLEGHDPDRARFMRIQCDLAKLPLNAPQRKELLGQEKILLEQHRAEWGKAFLEMLSQVPEARELNPAYLTFHRGIPDVISIVDAMKGKDDDDDRIYFNRTLSTEERETARARLINRKHAREDLAMMVKFHKFVDSGKTLSDYQKGNFTHDGAISPELLRTYLTTGVNDRISLNDGEALRLVPTNSSQPEEVVRTIIDYATFDPKKRVELSMVRGELESEKGTNSVEALGRFIYFTAVNLDRDAECLPMREAAIRTLVEAGCDINDPVLKRDVYDYTKWKSHWKENPHDPVNPGTVTILDVLDDTHGFRIAEEQIQRMDEMAQRSAREHNERFNDLRSFLVSLGAKTGKEIDEQVQYQGATSRIGGKNLPESRQKNSHGRLGASSGDTLLGGDF